MELQDIDQERLDNIDVFWLFFLFIHLPLQLTLYRHIVAVKATIDRQSPHAKIVVKVGGFYFRNGLCFFLFINSSPRLTLYRHIVAVKATIDKQIPHAKLLCLNISNELEISSF